MVKTFEKYIPSTEVELKKQLALYDIKEVKEQKNKINEHTGEKLKKAHNETMLSLLGGYILNKKIDFKDITIIGSNISFDGVNTVDTKIDGLTLEKLQMGIKMDFITRHFPNNNSGKKIEEKIALDYKNDFNSKNEIISKKNKFNSDIETFRQYLIENDPNNKQVYELIKKDELKSMWAGIQIELVTKLKVLGIEETTSGMEELLNPIDLEGLNGKTLSENWKEANGLLKAGATIAGLYGLYKVITSMWDSKKNPFKRHFWGAIGLGLVGELVGQVYTGESYTNKGLAKVAGFINGKSNLDDLKTQYKELDNNNNKIVDYSGLALLLLSNKTESEIKGNFDFINENTKDPFLQGIIIEEEKRGHSIEDLKKELKKGRETVIKNTTKGLPIEDKLSLNELLQVEGDTLLEKREIVINKIKTIKEDINQYKITNPTITEQIIFDSAKGQFKDKLINGGKLEINLGMGKKLEINL